MARTLIGGKVRERRKVLGITQAALAARAGISASYLNLIEANRRNIGGALLKRIADELGLPVARFDGAAERRLVDEVAEVALDPLIADLALVPASAAGFAASQPGWAQALVTLHRACLDRGEAVTALSDRLGQDPLLADAVHSMLTGVASIRSAAEILESGDGLDAGLRARFIANIADDSQKLSRVSVALSGYFSVTNAQTRSITPVEEVDDFFIGRDNHFPALEQAADALRAGIVTASGGLEGALRAHLASAHGRDDSLDGAAAASESSRRFALAVQVALLDAATPIATEIEAARSLSSAASRERAKPALASYVAGALLMPYQPFLEAATAARYDIDVLTRQFSASYEQVCQRLVTMRRPGREGVRFGFLRADPAGHVQKRFPLPRLTLPRYGSACPMWPLYGAFQAPGSTVRQLAEFPDGNRYLLFARSVDKPRPAANLPRRLMSVMLMCETLHADDLVYGDGLDLSLTAPHAPVGQTCRVCPRQGCAYRQEDPIVDATLGRWQ